MYSNKTSLLLDMNSTFMFGEDNFGDSEDYSRYFHKIGGTLSKEEVNLIIKSAYAYLEERYPIGNFRHSFPTVEEAINSTTGKRLSNEEITKLVRTFAHHEIGHIPAEYIDALHQLSERYTLAVVIDIWSPKATWLSLFESEGIDKIFSALSFSSDHGMVKPSPKPFELVINQLGVDKKECLMIGDSIRRDLGGAIAAGIDCVLVGGARHRDALGCYETLLDLSYDLYSNS